MYIPREITLNYSVDRKFVYLVSFEKKLMSGLTRFNCIYGRFHFSQCGLVYVSVTVYEKIKLNIHIYTLNVLVQIVITSLFI